jgi:hypothetical protein
LSICPTQKAVFVRFYLIVFPRKPENIIAIIDLCAGVGNLKEGLPDNILSHCILFTIEPND